MMIVVHELLVIRAGTERQIVAGGHGMVIGVLLLVLIELLLSSLIQFMIQIMLLDLLVSQLERQRKCLPQLNSILIEFLCVDLREHLTWRMYPLVNIVSSDVVLKLPRVVKIPVFLLTPHFVILFGYSLVT